MKRTLLIAMATLFMVHCNESDELSPPKITVTFSPVVIGDRSIAEDADEFEFDVHLQNKGEQTLEIASTRIRGDQNCAFSKEGPDRKELGENDSAFIRMTYRPTVRAEDNISLIVNSNSEEHKKLIIPICGRGVLPEELPDETDTETEAEEGDEDDLCYEPPDDQPDCEEEDTEGE